MPKYLFDGYWHLFQARQFSMNEQTLGKGHCFQIIDQCLAVFAESKSPLRIIFLADHKHLLLSKAKFSELGWSV